MKTNKLMIGLALIAAVGCKKSGTTEEPAAAGDKYFIAAVQGGGTYMLTVDDLESTGTTTTIGNGIENPMTFTHYAYNGTKAVIAINYQQGDPAVGYLYGVSSSDNKLTQLANGFELTDGFSTLGPVGNNIVTARSGMTLTDGGTGATFHFMDLNNNNNITKKTMTTTNFYNKLTASFIGIVDAGNGEFLTGVELTNGSVDSVYVAKFDANLNVKQIYRDGRLSRTGGQFRSARYSQIANDDAGNSYVFSGSYSTATTKKAGALLIKNGTAAFDADYYFNIEEKSGGYRFRKVWHITEDYFFLEFYNDLVYSATSAATQYAIVKMSDKSFAWVTGLPAKEDISNAGWPFPDNGKMYLPVTAANAQPAVYYINPKTAVASKGITVDGAESIGAVARLTPQ